MTLKAASNSIFQAFARAASACIAKSNACCNVCTQAACKAGLDKFTTHGQDKVASMCADPCAAESLTELSAWSFRHNVGGSGLQAAADMKRAMALALPQLAEMNAAACAQRACLARIAANALVGGDICALRRSEFCLKLDIVSRCRSAGREP